MADELPMREYPAWREAVKAFLNANFQPGDVVPESWFYNALDIEQPLPTMQAAQAEKLKLLFLRQFTILVNALLTDHNIHMRPTKGGRRVLPPPEQTAAAFDDGMADISKGLRKMCKRLAFTDVDALTDGQRTENRNAQVQAAFLQKSLRTVRKTPLLEGGGPKELKGPEVE